jgi:hypothetical protein
MVPAGGPSSIRSAPGGPSCHGLRLKRQNSAAFAAEEGDHRAAQNSFHADGAMF